MYRPLLGDDDTITALIVWDPLNEVDAGGIVDHYSVNISGPIDRVSSMVYCGVVYCVVQLGISLTRSIYILLYCSVPALYHW